MEKMDGREILRRFNENSNLDYKKIEGPEEGDVCVWEVTGPSDTIEFCFSNGEWWSMGEKANEDSQKRLTQKYLKDKKSQKTN